MDYPCICKDMKWFVDTLKVCVYQDNRWILVLEKIDKDNKGFINIEQNGIVIHHCMFCGKKINNEFYI